ncbi:ABC transporter ATP-binding protein [Glaciecola sp. XM2]|uniref:ABC transporter ATP-binding protein n=1 Tax=Glaciecola sp. XM2 TaxID=1914931 RepID=UPI001BDF410C|nr:ABC transporter ATP-binding protein [Glaciecola sp. XM2]
MLSLSNITLDARLHDVSLQMQQGHWWMLLGANGAGKSSLLNLVAGIEHQYHGGIALNNESLQAHTFAELARVRCLVSQAYSSAFSITVSELLRFFTSIDALPALIESKLELSLLLTHDFDKLSGGEKQRVHLARNLMQVWPMIEQGKALILLDEPLQQLDVKHQFEVLSLFEALREKGNLLVMSHHDVNQAMHYATHACLLSHGRVIEAGKSSDVLTQSNVEGLYQQRFTKIKSENGEKSYLIAQPDA